MLYAGLDQLVRSLPFFILFIWPLSEYEQLTLLHDTQRTVVYEFVCM